MAAQYVVLTYTRNGQEDEMNAKECRWPMFFARQGSAVVRSFRSSPQDTAPTAMDVCAKEKVVKPRRQLQQPHIQHSTDDDHRFRSSQSDRRKTEKRDHKPKALVLSKGNKEVVTRRIDGTTREWPPCRNGASCTFPGCKFQHPQQWKGKGSCRQRSPIATGTGSIDGRKRQTKGKTRVKTT
eukprot:SAG31_NODE_3884_length_3784_cov_2.194030_5_plen_182_part_00